MNTLIDIFQAVVYLIVSLIIISVLGVIYLGFVIFVLFQELFKYLKQKLQ